MKYDCAYYKMFLLIEVLNKTPNLSKIRYRINPHGGYIVINMYYRNMPVTMYMLPHQLAKYTNTQLAKYIIKRGEKIYLNSIYGNAVNGV